MAGLFIKLDHDWQKDPKVRRFRKEAGKAGLVDLVQLFIALSRNKGRIDMNDYGQAADLADTLGMTGQRTERTLDLAADCGVIDKELWDGLRVVTSNRAVKDARLRETRGGAGRKGGEASAEARGKRAKQGAEANS